MGWTSFHFPDAPHFIHVLRLDRWQPGWEFRVWLAGGRVCGLATVTEMVESASNQPPLVAVNGDFFQTKGAGAGDPRGAMIWDGELVSAPSGGTVFWIDPKGRPRVGEVTSALKVTWPNGHVERVGLNEELKRDRAALLSWTFGPITRATNQHQGVEIILEPNGDRPWLPLRVGTVIEGRVRATLQEGNMPIDPNALILAVPKKLVSRVPHSPRGTVLKISIATKPDLAGVRTAIGGGPVIVKHGWNQIPRRPYFRTNGLPYSILHRWDPHPRTALGWNDRYYYLVAVDGRQQELSEGMTLHELGRFMAKTLNCDTAINLDGGGSTTLWYDGEVRNYPSEGIERRVSNGLLVVPTAPSRAPPAAPDRLDLPPRLPHEREANAPPDKE